MNRFSLFNRKGTPARIWLAGTIAGLLLLLSVYAVHHAHSDGGGHQACVLCLMAHGGLIADGAIGVVVFGISAAFAPLQCGKIFPASVFDLRLAPGRAPPV
jgi:disulfide bond formation protein DsbB